MRGIFRSKLYPPPTAYQRHPLSSSTNQGRKGLERILNNVRDNYIYDAISKVSTNDVNLKITLKEYFKMIKLPGVYTVRTLLNF